MATDTRRHAEPAETGFSLLQSSAATRLTMVAVLLAALWGACFWAMN